MKKSIFVILTFLLLTGCEVKYDLIYENDIYKENVLVQSLKDENCGDNLCSYYYDLYYNSNISTNFKDNYEELAENINLDKYNFYNKKIIDNNYYGIKLGYEFNEDYKYSYVVNRLYENLNITEKSIEAYNINDIYSSYPFLDVITISFKTDKKVEYANADKVENDIFYWVLNKNNWKDKNIKIVFSDEKTTIHQNNIFKSNNISNFLYIFLGIMGIVILISTVVIYEKVKNSNK